jgi:large subunit ribosomal protein L5
MSKTPRLKEKYFSEVVPALEQKFGYSNVMQVPKIVKVMVNMGVSDAIQDPKVLEAAAGDMQLITGQKPVITRAKKSIAAFKVREGMPIGCKVTLRGPKMYYFLDKLFNVALPRIRDFRGVSPNSLDGRGNYTLGLKEQLVFPEVEYDKVDKIRGMDITIVTSAHTDEEGLELLKLMGLPVSR